MSSYLIFQTLPHFAGELGRAPAAVNDSLPVAEPEGATALPEPVEEDMEDMQARLEALRS